ncbi:Contactin-5 [Chelonia mydas]|uniref:Contactin-5 n=1 Tax=Chelonia mydas TaxID=8469 RepID=M7C6F5_CHEMY|nr:Contactin-5 [Chelonia mydas]
MYECKAENSRGRNVFRGQLQVYTYPHWVEKLNNTQLDSGEQLRWECKATGKPRPTYHWLKNGVPLWVQSRVEMVNGVLMIHSVNLSDAGMYQCLAENKYGTIYASAELKILASAPTFALNQMKKTLIITRGQEVVIECKPQASPKPTITWKKGDKAVRGNKRSSGALADKTGAQLSQSCVPSEPVSGQDEGLNKEELAAAQHEKQVMLIDWIKQLERWQRY